MFELNNRFVFQRTSAVGINSTLAFLQLIHAHMASGNIDRSSVYIFPVVSVKKIASWSRNYILKKCSLLKIENF